jgi:large subunit ribosomal protein L24
MAKYSIKKDDYVMVIAGKDKGKTALVLGIDTDNNRATIEGKGLTVKKKAIKARKASDKSGIIDMPATIDVSNLMPICAACDKPTRVGHTVVDGKKQRVCKKCGAILETKKVVEKKAKATVKKRAKKEEAVAENVDNNEATAATEAVETAATENKAAEEVTEKATKEAAAAPKATATVTRKKVVKE